MADAALRGGRWVAHLDDALAAGNRPRECPGTEDVGPDCGRGTVRCRNIFVGPTFETEAPIGVVSTFTSDNEFLAGEILNLASRRSLLCRAIAAGQASAATFAGLQVVLYADPEPAPAALAQALKEFALAGGLVVTPAKSAPKSDGKPLESPVPGYVLKAFGKGRIAWPEPEWEDPFLIAAAVHNLASRRVDPLRVCSNTSTALFNYGHAKGTRQSVVHMVNYSGRPPANPVTLSVQRKSATAKFYTPGSAAGTALPVVQRKYAVEFPLPAFPVWGVVEMEG